MQLNNKNIIGFLNISTFDSSIYTFSLARNKIVYRPSQGTNKGYYFSNNMVKEKMPNLSEKNIFPSIASLVSRVFSIFPRK